MQAFLTFSLIVYIAFYLFEGAVRYGLNLLGMDQLIFTRDALLFSAILTLIINGFLRRQTPVPFILYLLVITLHGLVMMLNIGNFPAVAYGAKMLFTLLAGGLAADIILKPQRIVVSLLFLFWVVTWGGIFADKYLMEMPWMGIETIIGDVKVELGRDWTMTGEDKRAGGFTRSSIHAAAVLPLLALMLLFNLRSLTLKALVGLSTIPALYWTTQKGAMIAYMLVFMAIIVTRGRSHYALMAGILVMMTLMVGMPLILSGETMPDSSGLFSFSSFYMRIEDMWPHAWRWIADNEAFPFGVGLGGISGAQRLYAKDDMNAADNLFVFMYAYFGMMSFVYLAASVYLMIKAVKINSPHVRFAFAILLFIFSYGCVLSMLEDQMISLFLGASLAGLSNAVMNKRIRHERQAA